MIGSLEFLLWSWWNAKRLCKCIITRCLASLSLSLFCRSRHWAHSNRAKLSQTNACSSHLHDCYWWNIVWIRWYIRLLPRNEMVWTNAVTITGNPWLSIFTSSINESQPTTSMLWLFRYLIKTLVNCFALVVMTTNNRTSCWHCLPMLQFPQYTDKFCITWKSSIQACYLATIGRHNTVAIFTWLATSCDGITW